MTRVYEEIIDFLARETKPGKLAAFEPSQATRERVGDLIRREKSEELNEEERAELNHYLEIEHLMRLAKARARGRLPNE